MRITTELPKWFDPDKLKLVNYWRYTSYVDDEVFRITNHNKGDAEHYAIQLAAFEKLKRKAMSQHIDIGEDGEPDIRTRQWDNKVVLEVQTETGETYMVGYYDWTFVAGTGRRGDSWVKPYPFVNPTQK